jgi:hypothetical protein
MKYYGFEIRPVFLDSLLENQGAREKSAGTLGFLPVQRYRSRPNLFPRIFRIKEVEM